MKLENKLLEDFKKELVKLCKKYNAKIEGSGDYGISIYSITPDGVESENP